MEATQELSKELTTTEELNKEGMKLTASYAGEYATVSLVTEVKLIQLLEKMALSTENKIDDMLIGMVKAAL